MEDTELLGMAFHGQQYTLPRLRLPRVVARLRHGADTFPTTDGSWTLLHLRRPPYQWLFKAPHHNFHLEAIAAAYPDARFVMTHRDPVRAVPSWVSLVSAILPSSNNPTSDLHRLGTEASNHLHVGVERAIRERAGRVGGEDACSTCTTGSSWPTPGGRCDRIYDFPRDGPRARPGSTGPSATGTRREPHRRARHAPLHRRAVRAGADDQLRSDFAFYSRSLRHRRRRLNGPEKLRIRLEGAEGQLMSSNARGRTSPIQGCGRRRGDQGRKGCRGRCCRGGFRVHRGRFRGRPGRRL